MLINLLKAINHHPFSSLEQLGQEMKVSPDLMDDMVANLSKRGYLKSYEECQSACEHCSLSTNCEGHAHPRIWTLTEKGRQLANR